MNKGFSAKKILGLVLAVPVIAGVFYLILKSIILVGGYLEQYIGVIGYIVAIVVVAIAVNLICKAIIKPIRKALFPGLDEEQCQLSYKDRPRN